MARKSKAVTPEAPANPSETGGAESTPPAESAPDPGITSRFVEPSAIPTKERLSVALNPDGSIDLESARGATREKLRRAGFRAPGEVEPVRDVFTTEQCRGLYQTLAGIQAGAAIMFLKCPAPIAQKVFAFDERAFQQKDKLTRKILDKYAGDFAYKDEIMLAVMLGTEMVGKITACRLMMAALAAGQVRLEDFKPNGVAQAEAQ